MRILLSSHFFAPSVGGVEEVSLLLAREFSRVGHEVRVVTQTAADDGTVFPFEVLRRPSPGDLVRSVRWCDVFFQNNISLRTGWPLLLLRRPWVVAHHTWIARPDGSVSWRDRVKRRLLRRATNIGGGAAMGRATGVPTVVIENPIPDEIYRRDDTVARSRDLLFVGRLVSDKGADLLLTALGRLKDRGLRPNLTVVGSGPEEGSLKQQCAELGLETQVEFVGTKKAPELATLFNRHRIVVMPSRWKEPFGLVALEGIACGCVVIGSVDGGLKDAIGPCGVTFPNGDIGALTERLGEMLGASDLTGSFLGRAEAQLRKHRPAEVARAYLDVFATALQQHGKR